MVSKGRNLSKQIFSIIRALCNIPIFMSYIYKGFHESWVFVFRMHGIFTLLLFVKKLSYLHMKVFGSPSGSHGCTEFFRDHLKSYGVIHC